MYYYKYIIRKLAVIGSTETIQKLCFMICNNNCHAKEAQAELVYSQERLQKEKKPT